MAEDPESDLVRELRALGGERAKASDVFVIAWGEQTFTVTYRGGSSSSLTLSARYDEVAKGERPSAPPPARGDYRKSGRGGPLVAVRPLAITLRRETFSDVEAKGAGINVEYQTGDATFDSEVYVCTPTTDSVVLGAVLGAAVRDATRALLALGFHTVVVDVDGFVRADLNSFARRDADPRRGARAVEAFATLLASLPPIGASGGVHPSTPWWAHGVPVLLVGVAAVVIGTPSWFAMAGAFSCMEVADDEGGSNLRDGCGAPALVALAIAFGAAMVAAVVTGALVTPRFGGRSDTASRIAASGAAAAVFAFVVAFFVASAIGFSSLRF